MSLLSDDAIKELIKGNELEIEGFEERNLTPNGYDLSVKEILVGGKTEDKGEVIIPRKEWFAVSTKEYLKMPDSVAATLWIRTTWARQGIVPSFGMVDAGFHGELTLSAYCSCKDVKMKIGERFAQIVFQSMEGRAGKAYKDRSGGYFGQRGVTLERK